MDPRSELVAAGYQLEADAAIINLSPDVEVRANGVNYLIETCATFNLNPVQVLGSVIDNIKTQPAVQSALESPPTTKCHINVKLEKIHFEPQA